MAGCLCVYMYVVLVYKLLFSSLVSSGVVVVIVTAEDQSLLIPVGSSVLKEFGLVFF